MEYQQVSMAELKVDTYHGDNCDEPKPFFDVYTEGDMDSEQLNGSIEISVEAYPPGTKIIIQEPCCPKCTMVRELCELDEGCDFDWKNWIECEYG